MCWCACAFPICADDFDLANGMDAGRTAGWRIVHGSADVTDPKKLRGGFCWLVLNANCGQLFRNEGWESVTKVREESAGGRATVKRR